MLLRNFNRVILGRWTFQAWTWTTRKTSISRKTISCRVRIINSRSGSFKITPISRSPRKTRLSSFKWTRLAYHLRVAYMSMATRRSQKNRTISSRHPVFLSQRPVTIKSSWRLPKYKNYCIIKTQSYQHQIMKGKFRLQELSQQKEDQGLSFWLREGALKQR